jgi:hypothetical protein
MRSNAAANRRAREQLKALDKDTDKEKKKTTAESRKAAKAKEERRRAHASNAAPATPRKVRGSNRDESPDRGVARWTLAA